MFKLYLNKGTRTQIDEQNEKYEIIKTMGNYLKDDQTQRFMIIEIENKTPLNIDLIDGLLEYALYVEKYNASQKKSNTKVLKK